MNTDMRHGYDTAKTQQYASFVFLFYKNRSMQVLKPKRKTWKKQDRSMN